MSTDAVITMIGFVSDKIMELKMESMSTDKPSEFDMTNEQMREEFQRKYENGEISREAYRAVFDIINGKSGR